MFSSRDLDELVQVDAQPAVSLYLPTHMAGRETRQDPIRLKNLLGAAAERLAASHRSPEIETLLSPAADLLDDHEFWQHQQQGLAIFLAPGFARVHQLPIAVAEELALGRYPHIKPLLPVVEEAGPFWLLAITARHTRLYRGSRWSFAECSGLDLPRGVAEIRGQTEYQEGHRAPPVGRRGGLAKAQSLGQTPEETRKTELIELLHRITGVVAPEIKRDPAPVILAASPEIRGHFHEIAGWKEILGDGLDENPDASREEELHMRAYALNEQRLAAARGQALDRLNARLGSAGATTKPDEIVRAARYARIDTLFVDGDEHLWGEFDESADRIVAHQSAVEGSIDLLDYAALMTLRHGGRVVQVAREALPPPGLAAAILRY
jgi:hypothetical protein